MESFGCREVVQLVTISREGSGSTYICWHNEWHDGWDQGRNGWMVGIMKHTMACIGLSGWQVGGLQIAR